MEKVDDIYFLREAFKAAASLSQDANTQVGAILVSKNKIILSEGANRIHYGFSNRFESEMDPQSKIILQRPEKYIDLIHAEKDAIFTAIRNGDCHKIKESTLYATWTPCITCATTAINLGVTRFITHQSTTDWYAEKQDTNSRKDWDNSIKQAINLLQRKGIEYQCLTDAIGDVAILFDDKIRTP